MPYILQLAKPFMHSEVLPLVATSSPRLGTMATSIRALVLTASNCAFPSAQNEAITSIATSILFIFLLPLKGWFSLEGIEGIVFLVFLVFLDCLAFLDCLDCLYRLDRLVFLFCLLFLSTLQREWAGSPHRGHGLPAQVMSPSSHPPGMGGRVRFVLFLFTLCLVGFCIDIPFMQYYQTT